MQLYCLVCVVEAKSATLNDQPVPPVRPAVAILAGQTTCAEHIVIQQQSSLAGPNGSPLLMGRG